MPPREVPRDVAERARVLRLERRQTRSGRRQRPWADIAAELARQGAGRWRPGALSAAVYALPAATHPAAPAPAAELARLETSWRAAWEEERPDTPWPGLEDARRELLEAEAQAAAARARGDS